MSKNLFLEIKYQVVLSVHGQRPVYVGQSMHTQAHSCVRS